MSQRAAVRVKQNYSWGNRKILFGQQAAKKDGKNNFEMKRPKSGLFH